MMNTSVRTFLTLGQRRICLYPHGPRVFNQECIRAKRLLSTTVVVRLDSTEATLSSIGLAGNTPPGVLQALLEHVHLSFDLPWWGAIAASMFSMTKYVTFDLIFFF